MYLKVAVEVTICCMGAKHLVRLTSCVQVWLQQFAWTEGEKPGKLADRCEHMTNPDSAASLDEEPMFCMETALKALYWSTLVYRYDESAPDFTRDKPLKVIQPLLRSYCSCCASGCYSASAKCDRALLLWTAASAADQG